VDEPPAAARFPRRPAPLPPPALVDPLFNEINKRALEVGRMSAKNEKLKYLCSLSYVRIEPFCRIHLTPLVHMYINSEKYKIID
jgi:hypothetical protein